MHPAVIAAIIAGGASLASGAMQTFGSGGGTQSGLHEDDWILWEKNAKLQKEFAKHGVRWRVEDAKAAGLHPLAALGVNPASGSPIQVSSSQGYKPKKDFSWIRDVGQDISRAVTAKEDPLMRRIKEAEAVKAESQARVAKYHADTLDKEINSGTQAQKPFPDARSIGGNAFEGDLIPDHEILKNRMQKKGVNQEVQLTFNEMTGHIKYYPSQEIMDLISESMTAAASHYWDLGSYKAVIVHGKANPGHKNHTFYLNEKRKIERKLGMPVRLTDGGSWRAKHWQSGR